MLKCFGIMQLTFFKNLFVLSGVGVGGGSLVYANTHMMPSDAFFKDSGWDLLKNWKAQLLPFYDKARFMLGSAFYQKEFFEDQVFKQVAVDMGVGESYRFVDHVGVYFGKTIGDPYFKGLGPQRQPCKECAACMVGCRYDSKNTLDKNYLWFAEQFYGAIIISNTEVYKIEKTDHGSYKIHCKSSDKLFSKKMTFTSDRLVLSAGVLGTLKLLLEQKLKYKTLVNLSPELGNRVLANSEMIAGVSSLDRKLNNGIAISTLIRPDSNTTVELCKYPDGSGSMYRLACPASNGKNRYQRILNMVFQFLKSPFKYLRVFFRSDLSRNSVILLIMQSLPDPMKISWKNSWLGMRLKSTQDKNQSSSGYSTVGQEVLFRYASKLNAIPQNATTEVLFGMATTAHILGGCKMGVHAEAGVIDEQFRVHGYPGMYVLDGSVLQSNPGVNPALTITAISEYAMSLIEPKPGNQNKTLEELIEQQTKIQGTPKNP